MDRGNVINDGKFKDNYKVGKVLGSGAFGEVRKCIHIASEQVRAVKTLKKDKINDEERKRMEVEIYILREIDHHSILKIFEVYEDSKRFYIVTELV